MFSLRISVFALIFQFTNLFFGNLTHFFVKNIYLRKKVYIFCIFGRGSSKRKKNYQRKKSFTKVVYKNFSFLFLSSTAHHKANFLPRQVQFTFKRKKSILIIPSHDPFDQTAIFAELETQTRCSNITRTYCVNKSNRVFVCEQERTVK